MKIRKKVELNYFLSAMIYIVHFLINQKKIKQNGYFFQIP